MNIMLATIEEPGLDTQRAGTLEAPPDGAVDMHTMKGQVAVITGAACGIGQALALDMARRGEAVVFLGSIASAGNVGQISYSSTKAGLEGAASTLMAEAMYYGVRCSVIHPGFTDTPMVRALGEEYIRTKVLPQTQLKRLIKPEEIADAICFMVTNAAVSGELWADAGWRPAT